MITNDVLQEQNEVQKQLAEAAKNMYDYFARTRKSAQRIMNSTGITKQLTEL